MVDTARTQAALQAIFADNTSGAITPQDLRDLVISVAFYEKTAEETAAGITPTDYRYPAGNVKRYGAVGDNSTDDLVAFQNAHDAIDASYAGGEIIVPKGNYYLSSTWGIEKPVKIKGAGCGKGFNYAGTTIRFPTNTDGIRFYNGGDAPSGAGYISDSASIEGCQIHCSTTGTSGRGIYATTRILVKECNIYGFGGVGIEIWGDTVNGNADRWFLQDVLVKMCGSHGFYVHGSDAQVGMALNCMFNDNGGWGIYHAAYYTNIFMGCQMSGNTSGFLYDANSTTYQGAVLIGCYVENATGNNSSCGNGTVMIACPTIGWDARQSYIGNASGAVGFSVPQNGHVTIKSGDGAGSFTEDWRYDTQTGYMTGPTRYCISSATATTYFGDTGLRIETSGTAESSKAIFVNGNGTVGTLRTNGTQTIFYPNSGTSGTHYGDTNLKITTSGTADTSIASFNNANGEVGSIHTSGTATTYNTSSDYRLKENVKPLQSALDVMNKLNPVTFDWKSDGTSYTGFIAHELQDVIPIAVTGEKDGEEMQAVDQSKIVPFLVAAIKELSAKIDKLTL